MYISFVFGYGNPLVRNHIYFYCSIVQETKMNKIYKVKKMPQVIRWHVLNLPKVIPKGSFGQFIDCWGVGYGNDSICTTKQPKAASTLSSVVGSLISPTANTLPSVVVLITKPTAHTLPSVVAVITKPTARNQPSVVAITTQPKANNSTVVGAIKTKPQANTQPSVVAIATKPKAQTLPSQGARITKPQVQVHLPQV